MTESEALILKQLEEIKTNLAAQDKALLILLHDIKDLNEFLRNRFRMERIK